MTRTLTLRAADVAQLARTGIGYRSMLNELEAQLSAAQNSRNYPPHNAIEIDENNYLIQIAIAGFSKDEVTCTLEKNELTVTGESMTTEYAPEQYAHRGISSASFTKSFKLAEYVKVVSAAVTNGILEIHLHREVPPEQLPKSIDIQFNS